MDGGKHIVVKGETVALFWEYNYDETTGSFVSKYDLFDFDILVGDVYVVEPEEGEVSPMAEGEEEKEPEKEPDKEPDPEPIPDPEPPEIPDPEPEGPEYETIVSTLSVGGKIDKTCMGTQVVEIAEGYLLTAFFDEGKNGFSGMQLEFSCENDKEISFGNFKNFKQDVNVSYDFDDEDILSVEVDVSNSDEAEWVTLERNVDELVNVEAGQWIVFRLGGDAFVDASKFEVESTFAVLKNPEIASYNQEGTFYTEFKFMVSNNQFSNIQNVKLVSVRG